MNFHDGSITETTDIDKLLRHIFVKSFELLRSKSIVARDPNGGVGDLTPLFLADGASIDGYDILGLEYVESPMSVVGIDSSIVVMGESSDGFLFGLKGVIVSEYMENYEVHKIGPIPIFFNEAFISEVSKIAGVGPLYFHLRNYTDISLAKRVLISFFEYLLIRFANRMFMDSIIVLDGSLSMLRLYSSVATRVLLRNLSLNNNSLVGISKKTKLARKYPWLFSLVVRSPYPCVVKIPKMGSLGGAPYTVYVGVFRLGGVPMRVDLARFSNGSEVDVLNYIYSSSHTSSGYLEVLKEAHILSKISRGEVIGLKQYVEAEFGINFIESFSLRDVLFGAFNSGLGGGNENL